MSQKRKQLNLKVLPEVLAQLKAIQEETGLSQTNVISRLIRSYKSTKTPTNTTTDIQQLVKEEVTRQLATMNLPKQEKEGFYADDGEFVHATYIDESPPLPVLTPEGFYGKEIPPTPQPEYDLDDPMERMMAEMEEKYK